MAHGYLGDYDERWNRDDDRERERRDHRDRNLMFGERDRGFFGGNDEAFGRFREDDRHWRGSRDERWSSRDWRGSGEDEWRGGGSASAGGDWERVPRTFQSHQDDHYRSWRDRQVEALDRDYADYCREREQQFHQDFDSWRSQRRGNNPGPLQTGMAQTGQSHDPSGILELTNEAGENEQPSADPMDAATLGTNSNSGKRG